MVGKVGFLLAAAGLVGMAPANLPAQEITESAVKAAFIFNFAKFVEWPGTLPERFDLCIVDGSDPVSVELKRLEGRPVQQRPVRVRHVNPAALDIQGCQLVVIAPEAAGQVKEATRQAEGAHALTVSDSEGFSDKGGMIGLVVVEGGVRFDINIVAAQRAELKLSAQLLKLARTVKR